MIKLKTGLIRDTDYIDMPSGSWRNARNELYFDKHEAIVSEYGNLSFASLPANYVKIGLRPIKDDKFVVFSCHKDNWYNQTGSEIGLLDVNGNYTTVINDTRLNFNPNYQVACEHKYNSAGELIIVFTDDLNPPRILNVTNPSVALSGTALLNDDAANDLRIFPEVLPPYVKSVSVSDSGGALVTGAYAFFFAYETTLGGLTNYTHISNPVLINADPKADGFDIYDGAPAETATTKSILVNLDNLDTRYERVYLCVAKTIGGVVSYERFAIETITDSEMSFTYTGNEAAVTIAGENVAIDRTTYTKIKDFTQLDGFLYGANVSSTKELGYQPYALDITTKWVDETVALRKINGSHKDPNTVYGLGSFMPGEVYAFYAIPVLKDGTFARAYHIPGRAPTTVSGLTATNENSLISEVLANNPVRTEFNNDNALGGQVRYFHTRDTSDSDGTMGFWENNDETYPNDTSFVSNAGIDLRGEKVRHHKFPTLKALKDYGLDYMTQVSSGVLYNNGFYTNNWKIPDFTIIDPGSPNYVAPILQFDLIDQPVELQDGTLSNNERTYTYNISGPTAVKITVSVQITVDVTGILVGQDFTSVVRVLKNGSPILTLTESDTRVSGMNWFSFSFNDTINDTVTNTDTITIEYFSGQPFWQWSTSNFKIETIEVETTTNYLKGNVLGVQFENVVVPDSVADNIQGFIFAYAKRGGGNMTVLGHTLGLFASEYQLSGAATGSLGTNGMNANIDNGGGTDDLNKSIVRLHDFGMIRNKVAGTAFLRQDLELSVSATPLRNIADPDEDYVISFDYADVSTTETSASNEDHIRTVLEAEYIDHNVQVSDTYFNLFGESCLKARIANPNAELTLSQPTVDITGTAAVTHPGYLTAINAFRLNVYSSFYLQASLVTMAGNFLRVNSAGTYSSTRIFEGDTKLSTWGFRATAPYDHSTKSSEGNNTDKAIKAFYYLPVYSAFMLGYRHGTSATVHYWPGVQEEGTTEVDWHGRGWDFDNDYTYNDDYNKVNDLNTVIPFRHDTNANTGEHPNRIIRFQQTDPEEIVESWQVQLPEDYWELLHHRGEIWRIEAMSDRMIINLEETSALTVGKDRLEANATEIYLGIGDIFQTDPSDIIKSVEGYMGMQSHFGGVLTRAGYFFVDQNHGKVFMVGNETKEISGLGLRNYLRDNLPCQLAAQLGRLDSTTYRFDNPGNPEMPAIQMAYDEKYTRVIMTKRDFVITDENNWYGTYSAANDYANNYIAILNGTLIYFDTNAAGSLFTHENPSYVPPGPSQWDEFVYAHPLSEKPSLVTDKSFTLSFSLATGTWISFHDYLPDMIGHNRNVLLMSSGNTIYRHNVGAVGSYFGTIYKSYIEPVFTYKAPVYIQAFKWITSAEENDIVDWDASFDEAWVYNRDQASVVITLERTYSLLSRGVFRHVDDFWQFNGFYDGADSPDFIDVDFEPQNVTTKSFSKQKRFIGNYVAIRLIALNQTNKPIYLYGIAPVTRIAKR